MTERWLPIPGYEGRYEVSDLGGIRSLPSLVTGGRVLKPSLSKSGYCTVCLVDDKAGRRTHRVHRLVLLAFAGLCPEGNEAAHNNGIRSDNRLTNLRWATVRENADDKLRHGNHRQSMIPHRKLTEADVVFIRANYRIMTQQELAEMFGVHRNTIHLVHSGKSRWRSLAKLSHGSVGHEK